MWGILLSIQSRISPFGLSRDSTTPVGRQWTSRRRRAYWTLSRDCQTLFLDGRRKATPAIGAMPGIGLVCTWIAGRELSWRLPGPRMWTTPTRHSTTDRWSEVSEIFRVPDPLSTTPSL